MKLSKWQQMICSLKGKARVRESHRPHYIHSDSIKESGTNYTQIQITKPSTTVKHDTSKYLTLQNDKLWNLNKYLNWMQVSPSNFTDNEEKKIQLKLMGGGKKKRLSQFKSCSSNPLSEGWKKTSTFMTSLIKHYWPFTLKYFSSNTI